MTSNKRKDITILDKLAIIKAVDEKILKRSDLAKQYGISECTISLIMSKKDEILEDSHDHLNFKKKRRRLCKNEVIESCLYEWFLENRKESVPISGPILMSKASDFAALNGIKDFIPNTGWLHRFKARHNIRQHKISGESDSVNTLETQVWLDKVFPSLIDGYDPSCIYNADETGLFYKMLPEYTLDTIGEKTSGCKKSKERITILFCINADGSDKCVPLVISKAKKPRCFNGVKTLPVHYEANSNAWMTQDLFRNWLLQLNNRMLKLNKKIVLFLDNFSGHKIDNMPLSNIKIHFYPPNCTSVLQPLDQGIIRSFKSKYRTRVLMQIISKIDFKESSDEINVYQAILYISMAWKQVSQETIKNCFALAGHKVPITFPLNEDIEKQKEVFNVYCQVKKVEKVNFDLWAACDIDVPVSGISTDKEIVDNVTSTVVCNEFIELNIHDEPSFVSIDLKTGIKHIEELKHLFLNLNLDSSCIDECELMLVNETFKNRTKQTSISDFYK